MEEPLQPYSDFFMLVHVEWIWVQNKRIAQDPHCGSRDLFTSYSDSSPLIKKKDTHFLSVSIVVGTFPFSLFLIQNFILRNLNVMLSCSLLQLLFHQCPARYDSRTRAKLVEERIFFLIICIAVCLQLQTHYQLMWKKGENLLLVPQRYINLLFKTDCNKFIGYNIGDPHAIIILSD